MWALYDELISVIPDDLTVLECMVGVTWTLVRSERGIGAAMTMKGGAEGKELVNIAGMSLKELAGYAKSWDMMQASLGMAAINAAFNTREAVEAVTGKPVVKTDDPNEKNGFGQFLPEIAGKKVAVIGHFPNMEPVSRICELSVLERQPQAGDYPDPACEYILPDQDYVFITGTTFINKTITRLLELSQKAKTVLIGPSAPLTPLLFNHGVDAIAGTVVLNEQSFWRAAQEGVKTGIFKRGGQMVCIRR